jgi:hypothetical protein
MFAIPCYLPQLMMLDTEEKYAYLVKHTPKAKTPSVKIIIKAKVFKMKKVSMPFASPAVQHAYTLCLKVGWKKAKKTLLKFSIAKSPIVRLRRNGRNKANTQSMYMYILFCFCLFTSPLRSQMQSRSCLATR